ncbi:MAG: hypothetical protein Tsb0019_12430 [Roseibium sp.]
MERAGASRRPFSSLASNAAKVIPDKCSEACTPIRKPACKPRGSATVVKVVFAMLTLMRWFPHLAMQLRCRPSGMTEAALKQAKALAQTIPLFSRAAPWTEAANMF